VLDPEIEDELAVSRSRKREYPAGEVDRGRVPRLPLNQGILRPAPGGHHQMVRVKIHLRKDHTEQLEVLGFVAETTRSGWGHLTTRQNVQSIRPLSRRRGPFGSSGRRPHVPEACGDTVRNVTG